MEAIIYVSIAIFFLSLTYRAIIKVSGSLSLDFISFWFYIYIIFAFLGSCVIILGFGSDSYFVLPIAKNHDVILVGSYFVLYGGVVALLAFLGFIKIFNANKIYSENLTKTCEVNKSQTNTILILACLFLLVFIYFQISIFPSPLVMAFTNGTAEEIALRRIIVTKDLSIIANTYIISVGSLLAYIVPYSYLALSSINKKYYAHALLTFTVSIIYILSTGEKGPFLFFIFGALICYGYSRGQIKRISVKLILFSILILFVIYLLFVSNDIQQILSLIFDRIFIAQVISVYLSYDYYSYSGDIGLLSLANILTKIFDISVIPPASEQLMAHYFPEMIALGGWNINGLYISEAWSNFGVLGVLLSPILVGFENAILIKALTSFKKSPIQCAFYAFFTIKCTYFLTSFNAYLYHSDWIVTVIVLLLIMFLNFIFNAKKQFI